VLPYFPEGTLHVIVVDPGVGTDRAMLCVAVGGHVLLVPDNGCWTEAAARLGGTPSVVRLAERRFWRDTVSATFHGRDILAPVAGHLSRGSARPPDLGPRTERWVKLDLPVARAGPQRIEGEVVFVDDFGNLITNIGAELYEEARDRVRQVLVGGAAIDGLVRTYGEAPPGRVVALVSSSGTLEVAVVQGNAARRLNAAVGTPVRMDLGEAAGATSPTGKPP